MTPEDRQLLKETRRHFFARCGIGLGQLALAQMVSGQTRATHFPPKVKSVIFLFMAGGPSQFDLWEHKPMLTKYDGQPIPQSLIEGKRFAFMDAFSKEPMKVLASRREFKQYGQSGAWVSNLMPNISGIVDDVAFVSGISTDNFNHGPAKCFVNTGSTRFGRPSMGSWITYGIGSEAKDLPGFVVLQSGPRGPRGGASLWSSGFIPSAYQGVPFRSGGDPILDLSAPEGVNSRTQRQTIDAIRDLNMTRLAEVEDPEISTRISSYEMAYRMQTSGPGLIDFSTEKKETLEMYGVEPGMSSYANNCLLARRLVEKGVRFVQLYHTDWDHHEDLGQPLEKVCKETDQPTAALIKDLKQRGLLDSTLVIWGGEFGRTPMGEKRTTGKMGRNHHIDAYTMFMTGGGIRKGQTVGGTDELGYTPTQKIHVHDVQATILQLLGLDHKRLTYRFQGRDFRLTDVGGEPIKQLLI